MLKAIITKDIDLAIKLGVLDLSPEDLAIFTLVCPGKIDYGKHLQELLDLIENEET